MDAAVLREPGTRVRPAVAPSGKRASCRVRAQLVGRDLPNDAIGESEQVAGGIPVAASGITLPR